jgi:flagellar biosynthesis anti-sigma factor FlgM
MDIKDNVTTRSNTPQKPLSESTRSTVASESKQSGQERATATELTQVQITQEAQALQKLTQQNTSSIKDIDEGQLAAIKSAIQAGKYPLNADKLASNLAKMEIQISQTFEEMESS